MFKYEKNNEKVGAYLKKLIEAKYTSHRKFCKAYLDARGDEANDEELRKLGNRLSQILKGNKAIQTYDLPYFTDLLEVSCEEILSCGKSFVPISGHITNYEVAFSNEPKLWEEYLESPDNLILNPDEYNKTIIDYAIEFKNYRLIKYLMDKGAIWFVDDSKNDSIDRVFGFAAGTDIKRREIGYNDVALVDELYHCEERGIRQNVIALAMENKDFDILESLKARENPALYQLCIYSIHSNINCFDYYNDDVIEEIAHSNDKVLSYFSDEFIIKDAQEREHIFVYPFLGKVIERLIKIKSKYAETVIRKAIEHNKNVFNSLSTMISNAKRIITEGYPEWREYSIETVKQEAMRYFEFSENDNFVSYMFPVAKHKNDKLCSNIVNADVKSNDFLIDSLIDEMNKLSYDIKNIDQIMFVNEEGK